MAGKKRVDPVKQREKRAKIAAAVGGVLFIIVGAYEVPTIMSSLNQKPPPSTSTPPPPSTPSSGSSAALPNVALGSAPAGSGALANTDAPPPAGSAQLVAFSLFQTKNPFAPQGMAAPRPPAAAPPGGAGTSTTTSPTTTSPTTVSPATTSPATTSSATTSPSLIPGTPAQTSTTATTPAAPAVSILVNNVVSRVGLQGTFPASSPVFRLMSYTAKAAQIGIVGGSYATGDQSLTLQIGQAVTLENTSDQKTYKLELVATP